MLKLVLKKWWVTMIQGIVLIMLSIYIFSNPLEALQGISVWVGILILIIGLVGIISWVGADTPERESKSFFWSLLTAVFGLVILSNIFTTMKMITVIAGIWMLVTSWHLVQSGLELKKENPFRMIMIVAGILSAIAALLMIFDIGRGATGISILLGLQVLLAGVALIIFAFAKRSLVHLVKEEVKVIRPGFPY